jgi:hypothetical protein
MGRGWVVVIAMVLGAGRARAAPWFCTSSPAASIGTCEGDANSCEAFRASRLPHAPDLTPCTHSDTAACFEIGGVEQCAPELAMCEAQRPASSHGLTITTCTLREVSRPRPGAEPDASTSTSPPVPRHEEYYAGTMIAIEVPVSVVTLSLGSFVVSPLVHMAKGNSTSAVISLGLHVGLPLGLAALADRTKSSSCSGGGDMGCSSSVVGAYATGVIVAMLVDYTFLCHHTVGAAIVPSVGHNAASVSGMGAF